MYAIPTFEGYSLCPLADFYNTDRGYGRHSYRQIADRPRDGSEMSEGMAATWGAGIASVGPSVCFRRAASFLLTTFARAGLFLFGKFRARPLGRMSREIPRAVNRPPVGPCEPRAPGMFRSNNGLRRADVS